MLREVLVTAKFIQLLSMGMHIHLRQNLIGHYSSVLSVVRDGAKRYQPVDLRPIPSIGRYPTFFIVVFLS